MNNLKETQEVAVLLQQKVQLLQQQQEIAHALVTLEPRLTTAQQKLVQSTCDHDYQEISANTTSKYSGWGEYMCKKCKHTKQSSW